MRSHDEERPLSAQERASLRTLEEALRDADPRFERRLGPGSRLHMPTSSRRWQLFAAIGMVVVGLATTIATFARSLSAAVVGSLIVTIGLGWAVRAILLTIHERRNRHK